MKLKKQKRELGETGGYKLYHHKTDGGAEYLMDNYILCKGGHREGVFQGSQYVIRIDGNIEKDAELFIKN